MAAFWAILGKLGNFLFHHLVALVGCCIRSGLEIFLKQAIRWVIDAVTRGSWNLSINLKLEAFVIVEKYYQFAKSRCKPIVRRMPLRSRPQSKIVSFIERGPWW